VNHSGENIFDLVTPFVDDELSEELAVKMAQQIKTDPKHRRLVAAERALKNVLATRVVRRTAPAALKQALSAAVAVTYRDVPIVNFGAGSWTIHSYSSSNEYHSSTMTWTGKYLGKETVTTPAGTFENCVKVQLVMTSHSTFPESDWEETWIDTTTLWFASGVGYVKDVSVQQVTGTDGTMETMETNTSLLKSYTLP